MTNILNSVGDFFQFKKRNTNFKKEIMGGIIAFFSMSYILFVQPDMIASVTGLDIQSLFIVTALTAAIFTIAGALLTNTPTSFAPAMGMNAFFAFSLVASGNMTFEEGYGVVMLSGIIFFLVTAFGLREKIVSSIPSSITRSMMIGLGLFIAFVGLKNSGLVAGDGATFVTLGDFTDPAVITGLITIITAISLWSMKVKGAILWSMAAGVILGLIFGATPWGQGNGMLPQIPNSWSYGGWENIGEVMGMPFKAMGSASFWTNPAMWSGIFILFMIDFFDSTATISTVLDESGIEKGTTEYKRKFSGSMLIDATATLTGPMIGSTSITAYAESLSATTAGARTGMSALTTGVMFLISLAISPALSLITGPVAGGALMLVGIQISTKLMDVNWKDPTEIATTVVSVLMSVLTFSVANGIMFAIITWVIIKMARREFKDINYLMYSLLPISITFLVMLSIM